MMADHERLEELIVARALGGLETGDERAYQLEREHHLADCAECRRLETEYGEVAGRLAFSLDPEPVSQDLEERVVAAMPRSRDRRRLPPWAAAVAATFCVLAVLGAVFIPDLSGGRALASATLTPTDLAPDAGGEVSLRDAGTNMEVRLEAWGLPACEDDRYYELWLVEGEERVSAGSFTVGPSGKVEVDMNAPDFAGSYPTVGITYEHDKDPRAGDAKMLSGELHEL